MNISVITVPYHLGKKDVSYGKAPQVLLDAGIVDNLLQAGHVVSVLTVEIEDVEPFDENEAVTQVNGALARLVGDVVARGDFPLVVAGNCNHSLGMLAGFNAPDIGVVWFDAHSDLNTRETSPTGYYDGMALALSMRAEFAPTRDAVGMGFTVAPERVVLVGTRDLDPGERDYIDATGIEVAGTDIDRALQCIQQLDAEKIYVHVDLDTLDPAHFSALGFPTPDGLSPEQVETVLAATKDRMAGLLITSLDPEHDSAEQAIRIAGELAIFGLIT